MITNFKTIYGKQIGNVIEYINEYFDTHDNIELLIGCDSQSRRKMTTYVVVVVLYTVGKGGHVLCTKESVPKEKSMQVRLLNEVWKSVEVAEYFKENGIPQVKYIDIDLNPDPRWASNTVIRQAVGLVEGMGYKVRTKHNGAMVTCSADHIVKK